MALNVAGQTFVPASLIYSDGWAKYAAGSNTFDATAITTTDYIQINVGFIPKLFLWCNDTSRVQVEWRDGMAADSCIKTAAAGTRTLEVTGGNKGVVVGTGALTSSPAVAIPGAGQVQVSQNATLAAILASQVCRWYAFG